MPKTLNAEQLRNSVLTMLKKEPDGVHPRELQIELMGDTNDLDEHRRRQQRLFHALRALLKAKHVTRIGKGAASVYRMNNGRPAPEIADIPANGHVKRKYTKRGSKNGTTNGHNDVMLYIVRDIESKFAELKSLMVAES